MRGQLRLVHHVAVVAPDATLGGLAQDLGGEGRLTEVVRFGGLAGHAPGEDGPIVRLGLGAGLNAGEHINVIRVDEAGRAEAVLVGAETPGIDLVTGTLEEGGVVVDIAEVGADGLQHAVGIPEDHQVGERS